jgi:hypothetical protein
MTRSSGVSDVRASEAADNAYFNDVLQVALKRDLAEVPRPASAI